MVRSFSSLCLFAILAVPFDRGAAAEERIAYELLPDSVQAVVWIRDSNDLTDRWSRTALHEVANDPTVKPFFNEQQEMIQDRLMEAGWRLGVKPQELMDYFEGQVAVAWLELPDVRKPFALAMIADVVDNAATNEKMMLDIDTALAPHQQAKKQLKHLDQQITQYTLPKRPGQLLNDTTFLAVVDGKLIMTDDLPLIQQIVSQLHGQGQWELTLADDPDFIASREHLRITGSAQIEFFIRPLGIARVVRAISGKRSKSSADILEVLKNQGFTALKCISGEVWVAEAGADIAHRGFVLAELPLPRSAAVLDFPNQAMLEVPGFVSQRASSFMATNWNAQTAFWKVRDLVDEMIGNQGVFDEVINGIKNDVNGPQIDIRNEVLPLLTNDIVAITDNKDGEVEVDSRRNLIAVKVNDAKKAAAILDRVMKAEANAEMLESQGITIWKVTNEKEAIDPDEFAEFGAFDDEDEEQEEPWLNHWAICVLDSYFVFASHTEMIEEAIAQSRSGGEGHLSGEADFQRIRHAIMQLMDEQHPCAWKISRNQLAFRVQYELFRQGKLKDSESMLSTLLGRLIETDPTEGEEQGSGFDGHSLPPFETIAHKFQPSGFKVLTTTNGWEFGGLLLGTDESPATDLSGGYEGGTARIVDSASESKR